MTADKEGKVVEAAGVRWQQKRAGRMGAGGARAGNKSIRHAVTRIRDTHKWPKVQRSA